MNVSEAVISVQDNYYQLKANLKKYPPGRRRLSTVIDFGKGGKEK